VPEPYQSSSLEPGVQVDTAHLDAAYPKGDVALDITAVQTQAVAMRDFVHKVRIDYYPPRGDAKEGWDNIDLFGWLGYAMQLKINFLCRDSILAAPVVLDLALLLDLAQRAGLSSTQEWLSFYFKSPMTAPGVTAEHDLFMQITTLKNALRAMVGEEGEVDVGRKYYEAVTAA